MALQQPEKKLRKQRLIRLTILTCLLLIGMLTWLETRVFQLGAVPFPVSGNVLVFLLININVILLLLTVFLVLRNLVTLVFERRQRLLGARLRTKLVLSFISLSLIPTGLLFFIALQFVSTSMDYWFNSNVEQSLVASLELAKATYQAEEEKVRQANRVIAGELAGADEDGVAALLDDLRRQEGMDLAALYRLPEAAPVAGSPGGDPGPARFEEEMLRRVIAGEEVLSSDSSGEGDLVRVARAVTLAGDRSLLLVTGRLIPAAALADLGVISHGLEGYRQLKMLKAPIKTSLLVMLLIVTLLIVFAAIWFGFYVANGLTGPIGKLADATRRIAEGDLDFVLEKESGDEMGTLVDAFNRMTRDLLASRGELQEANRALTRSYSDLEHRRQYTEILLQNITAGVISLDRQGRVTTINRYAEELLRIDRGAILGHHYRSVLRAVHLPILENYLTELADSGKSSIQRHIRLTVGDELYSLRVNFVRLEDEGGTPLGVVLVFDNLTELEKAQRMAAWREVARRIAHEVKNPLTPIQLSAQRLRKKFLGRLGDEEGVFDSCTQTIVDQVEELKKLVGEFSSFARMPSLAKSVQDLGEMINEVLPLYVQAHPGIAFHAEFAALPPFAFDRSQLKRVLVNLLDNGVAALAGAGNIWITTALDSAAGCVTLTVADDGPGVPEKDKPQIFVPYYSTKKSGTGLGLAIAGTVVADHGGSIRVRDREPHGAAFVISLPLG
ncbi:MAG: ATP-binding protein [Thermodesulfobacteriota bacterium]